MMIIDNQYDIGDRVYIINDPDQTEYFVYGIVIKQGNRLLYDLSLKGNSITCHDFELSATKDIMKTTTN